MDSRHAATYAGLRADGIALVDIARLRAAQERVSSPEMPPSPRALALAVADAAHECARGGGKRAYGARLLLAGFGDDGHPELWSIGPGGDARFHQSIVAVGKDAHRVEKTSWEDYDAPTAAARAVATVIAAASPEEEEDFSVQMVRRVKNIEQRRSILAVK